MNFDDERTGRSGYSCDHVDVGHHLDEVIGLDTNFFSLNQGWELIRPVDFNWETVGWIYLPNLILSPEYGKKVIKISAINVSFFRAQYEGQIK